MLLSPSCPLQSWSIDRDVFNDEALKIQARFRDNAACDLPAAARLLREGQEELFKYTHPDPWIPNYMPGGSLFMRNPPLPLFL